MKHIRTLILLCAALAACDDSEQGQYDYFLLVMDESTMVVGCGGFGLGTVRVDRRDGSAMTCVPNKLGCNDTREPGCGEGHYASKVDLST